MTKGRCGRVILGKLNPSPLFKGWLPLSQPPIHREPHPGNAPGSTTWQAAALTFVLIGHGAQSLDQLTIFALLNLLTRRGTEYWNRAIRYDGISGQERLSAVSVNTSFGGYCIAFPARADDQNRTGVTDLEGQCNTIIPHPHIGRDRICNLHGVFLPSHFTGSCLLFHHSTKNVLRRSQADGIRTRTGDQPTEHVGSARLPISPLSSERLRINCGCLTLDLGAVTVAFSATRTTLQQDTLKNSRTYMGL